MNFVNLFKFKLKILFNSEYFKDIITISSRHELPSSINRRTLYLVGSPQAKWLILDCPCGCSERIEVNLMSSHKPSWSLNIKNTQATVWPSLWVSDDKCNSHFWIIKNKVIWTKEVMIDYGLPEV